MKICKYPVHNIFYVLFFCVSISSAFSQNFTRIIEYKDPPMNGPDVLNLQKRLLSTGFYEIGEADGYYGYLTERVIKNIQAFSGFISDGKVNKALWDYIFNNTNSPFLRNISTISTEDYMVNNYEKFERTRNLLYDENGGPGDYYVRAFVYYTPTDTKAKIIEFYHGTLYMLRNETGYFVNDNYYFVKYEYRETPYNFSETYGEEGEEIEKMFLINNNNVYEIINGVLKRSDYTFDDINDLLSQFYDEYR